MDYLPFPAVLRVAAGDIQVFGQGVLPGRSASLDFTAEFIPLLPLGQEATIEWILGNRTMLAFRGNVYLSSRELLRIVDVDSDILEEAKAVFSTNTRLPATVRPFIEEEGAPPGPKPTPALLAEIIQLGNGRVKLLTAEGYEAGSGLQLSCEVDFFTLHKQAVTVYRPIQVALDEWILICGIERGSDENTIALSTYSAKLARAEEN